MHFMKQFLYSLFLISTTSISCTSNLDRNQKIAVIQYESNGDFGSEKSKTIISQKDTSWIAELIVGNKTIETVKLNAYQIDDFNLFISELRNLKQNGLCTTVDYYIVELKKEIIKKEDHSCAWLGYRILQQSLFTKLN